MRESMVILIAGSLFLVPAGILGVWNLSLMRQQAQLAAEFKKLDAAVAEQRKASDSSISAVTEAGERTADVVGKLWVEFDERRTAEGLAAKGRSELVADVINAETVYAQSVILRSPNDRSRIVIEATNDQGRVLVSGDAGSVVVASDFTGTTVGFADPVGRQRLAIRSLFPGTPSIRFYGAAAAPGLDIGLSGMGGPALAGTTGSGEVVDVFQRIEWAMNNQVRAIEEYLAKKLIDKIADEKPADGPRPVRR